jgi:hypothetical protein
VYILCHHMQTNEIIEHCDNVLTHFKDKEYVDLGPMQREEVILIKSALILLARQELRDYAERYRNG